MPRTDLTLPFQDYYVSVAVLQCLVEPGKYRYVISCVTSDLGLLYNVNKSLNQILHCSCVSEREKDSRATSLVTPPLKHRLPS